MPSKSELKALGERRNYQDRELDARAVANLSSDEYLWFQVFYPTRLEDAAQRDANKKHNKAAMNEWAIKDMWEGKATPEESERARIAGDTFAMRNPTFARTIENATLMVEHMKSRGLDATEISSYTTAFRELTQEGKLTIAPGESADGYLRNHPELHDRRTPPIIQARRAQKEATQEYFAQAASAEASASVVNLVDYPREDVRGVPPYASAEKASFRNLLTNLSAREYAERCKDPSFRAAVDRLDGEK